MEFRKETINLISAEKVSGTDVYSPSGESLGEVKDVMLDKQTGRVAYAILSFGGFVGIGTKYHPLPWSTLHYDPDKGGYIVNLTKDVLDGSPAYDDEAEPEWDRRYEGEIHDYYQVPPYWI